MDSISSRSSKTRSNATTRNIRLTKQKEQPKNTTNYEAIRRVSNRVYTIKYPEQACRYTPRAIPAAVWVQSLPKRSHVLAQLVVPPVRYPGTAEPERSGHQDRKSTTLHYSNV